MGLFQNIARNLGITTQAGADLRNANRQADLQIKQAEAQMAATQAVLLHQAAQGGYSPANYRTSGASSESGAGLLIGVVAVLVLLFAFVIILKKKRAAKA